jgi:hypothetical protein
MNSYFERPNDRISYQPVISNDIQDRSRSTSNHYRLLTQYRSPVLLAEKSKPTQSIASSDSSTTPRAASNDLDTMMESTYTNTRQPAVLKRPNSKRTQNVVEYFKNKTIALKKSSLFNDSAYATLSNSSTTAATTTTTKPSKFRSRAKTIDPTTNNSHYYNGLYVQPNKQATVTSQRENQNQTPRTQRPTPVTEESVDLFNMNTNDLGNYIDQLRTNFRSLHLPHYQANQHHRNQPARVNHGYHVYMASQPSQQPNTDDDEFIKFTQSFEIVDDDIGSDSTEFMMNIPVASPRPVDAAMHRYSQLRRDACSRLGVR